MKFKKITTIMLAAVAAFSAIGATSAFADGSGSAGYSYSYNGISFVQGWGSANGGAWVDSGYLAIKGGGKNTATGSRTYKITGKVADYACNYGNGRMVIKYKYSNGVTATYTKYL